MYGAEISALKCSLMAPEQKLSSLPILIFYTNSSHPFGWPSPAFIAPLGSHQNYLCGFLLVKQGFLFVCFLSSLLIVFLFFGAFT